MINKPMKKQAEIKEHLVNELAEMRQRIAELEQAKEERKRGEEELRESEEKLRVIFESMSEGVVITDLKGMIVNVNQSLLSMSGLSREELIGRDGLRLLPTKDRDKTIDIGERVLKGKTSAEGMLYDVSPTNGKVYDADLSIGVMRDSSGNPTGFVAIVRDVTDSRQAEEALRESEAKYRDLVENVSDVIYSLDASGVITYISPVIESVLGYTPSELSDKSFADFIYQEDFQLAIEGFMNTLSGNTETGEFRVVTKSGEIRWVRSSNHPVFEWDRVTGVTGVLIDITERRWAEQELRESEEKYRTILENIEDSYYEIDINGNLTFFNDSLCTIIGYPRDELMGMNYREFMERQTARALYKIFNNVYRTEQPTKAFDWEIIRKDGTKRFVEASISLRFDSNGDPTGFRGITRDITERKEAEEEIKRYSRRVQALYTVAQAVSRSLDIDKLLTQSLKATLDVVNTDVGGIYFSDLQAGSLTLKAHSGLSQDCIGSIELINLDEEEIKLAMESHQPVLELEKVFKKTNLKTVTAAMKKDGLQAYVTVPLWSRGTPLGSLMIADHREHHFSPDELDLLSAIGTEIAVGIENALLLQRTKELSLTDELTGLYNRRHFYETLDSELYRTLRDGRPFSLVMLDLDGFKEYNDKFGHSLGDSILQSFAQTLRSTLRKSDTPFRYGGDEFAIILPATDANRAKQVIDRIRAKWLKNPEAHHPTLETPLGFSAGIAQFPENAETADALVFLADSALYYAKREGGYRATLVSDLTAIKSDILSTATLDQVYALAATVDARDPYTYGHSARVADIAQTLAKAIGLPEKELADLYAASLLHDVGKVGIPDAVLTKLDALTAKEWEIIKKHSAEGARIVGYVKGLAALVPVILHHHEWYDGTGYPDGLKGEEIPLAARIISLADAYDTMTTSRPYRDVVSHQKACNEIKSQSGTQFDPELVEVFCRIMAEDTGD